MKKDAGEFAIELDKGSGEFGVEFGDERASQVGGEGSLVTSTATGVGQPRERDLDHAEFCQLLRFVQGAQREDLEALQDSGTVFGGPNAGEGEQCVEGATGVCFGEGKLPPIDGRLSLQRHARGEGNV